MEEQKFHIDSSKDLLGPVKALRETIKSQEAIIQNLANAIKEGMLKNPIDAKEKMLYLDDMRFHHNKLQEKHKQLKILIEMNEGRLPEDYLKKLQNEEFEDNKPMMEKMKEESDCLMRELEDLTKQLNVSKQERVKNNEMGPDEQEWEDCRPKFEVEMHSMSQKARDIEREMLGVAAKHAEQVGNMKHQIMMLDLQIAASKSL